MSSANYRAPDYSKLSPAQAEMLRKDYEHLGEPSFLERVFGMDQGDPAGDRTLLVTMSNPRPMDDWLRGNFMRWVDGEEAARCVAQHIRDDLERLYPPEVNARCTHMAGEHPHLGVLAVTWMRGREVFHRRYEVNAYAVNLRGPRHAASWRLPAIVRHIQSTEGAERP